MRQSRQIRVTVGILFAMLGFAIVLALTGCHSELASSEPNGELAPSEPTGEPEPGEPTGEPEPSEPTGEPEPNEHTSELAYLAIGDTFNEVLGGVQLVLSYDAPNCLTKGAFRGTVKNTTPTTMLKVLVEVWLYFSSQLSPDGSRAIPDGSRPTVLGPITVVDLAPGQIVEIASPPVWTCADVVGGPQEARSIPASWSALVTDIVH